MAKRQQPRPIRVFSVCKPTMTPTLSRMLARILLAELRRSAELAVAALVVAIPTVFVAYWLLSDLQMRGW